MCGRYTFYNDEDVSEMQQIIQRLEAKNQLNAIKMGEIFPTNGAPALLNLDNRMDVTVLTWGFPDFQRKNGVLINARAETVNEKVLFKESFQQRRCILPATGFFEWDKAKVKHSFSCANHQLLYMAGIYRQFDGIGRFVVVTKAANQAMVAIHNRMPLILASEQLEMWLFDQSAALALLETEAPELAEQMVVNPMVQMLF